MIPESTYMNFLGVRNVHKGKKETSVVVVKREHFLIWKRIFYG